MKHILSLLLAGMVGGLVSGGLIWWLLKFGELGVERSVTTGAETARATLPFENELHETRASNPPGQIGPIATSGGESARADGRNASAGEQLPLVVSPSAAGPDDPLVANAATRAAIKQASAQLAAQNTTGFPLNVASFMEGVVVPAPSEVFNVLDKQGKQAWSKALQPLHGVRSPYGSSQRMALLLGTVIAEGFIAVEAENAEEVKNAGRSVIGLSEALGIRKAVLRRADQIMVAADRKNWSEVRMNFDHALADVRAAMNDIHSEDLAQLVSLGGWLRGTDALTGVVQANYTADNGNLFHQELLVDWFARQIDSMKSRTRDPIVVAMFRGLSQVRDLMDTRQPAISEAAVNQIGTITAGLLQMIDAPKGA